MSGIHTFGIINTRKKFKDVKVGERLYFINPNTGQIVHSTVTASAIHPKSLNLAVQAINFNKIDIELNDEQIAAAKKQGINTIDQILVERDQSMARLLCSPPTHCATTYEELDKWMKRADGMRIV